MNARNLVDLLVEEFDPEEVERIAQTPGPTARERIERSLDGLVLDFIWSGRSSIDVFVPHAKVTAVRSILKSIDPDLTGMSLDHGSTYNDRGYRARYYFPSLRYGNVPTASRGINGTLLPPRPS